MARRNRDPRPALPQEKLPATDTESGNRHEPGRPLASAEDAAWKQSFLQLQRYHHQHGHCEVPGHERIHRKLAAWIGLQREIQRRGGMRADRQAALDALGFVWKTEKKEPSQVHREAKWNERFVELVAFQKQHGHNRVPRLPPGNKVLWHWRHVQREWWRKGILKPERIARLDAIGFEWEEPDSFGKSPTERRESQWERNFQLLVEHHRAHGHCHVVIGDKGNRPFSEWVTGQRKAFKQGRLRSDRAERLNALGFVWRSDYHTWKAHWGDEVRAVQQKMTDIQNARWERHCAELVAFKELHGHTRVTKSPPGNPVLWHWRHVQREWRRKGILKPERIARLDAIGFEWEEPDRFGNSRTEKWENLWERMFQALVQFKERFGHCRVVTGWKENPALAKWVIRHRTAHQRGELRAARKARLDALGFDWQMGESRPLQELWERRYTELVAFKELHGHTRVRKSSPGNRVLWHWRHVQREFRRKGILKPERIARLDAIGFEWSEPPGPSRSSADFYEPLWNANFELLRQFKERFGHTRVPKRWKEHPGLGSWTQKQRHAIGRQKMSAEHKARLEALGFQSIQSEAFRPMWMASFDKLRQFKERFGHTHVPRRWKEDPSLGEWVAAQRRASRRNQLKPERKPQLESLGFEWHAPAASPFPDAQQTRADRRLAALADFKERFGHTHVPRHWQEDPGLGEWVNAQRRAGRLNQLKSERKAQLERLGFEWHCMEASVSATIYPGARDQRVRDLAAFKERFGHTRVPAQWKEDPGLGAWAAMQRHLRRTGRLNARRTAQLEALGFEWGRSLPSLPK